jgi:hypothetical protein
LTSGAEPEPSIELDVTSAPATGVVWLVNNSPSTWRVFDTGNSWGDEALSFEARREEEIVRIVPAAQTYTRNVPSVLEIAAHDRHALDFDLTDGTWEADLPIATLLSNATAVRAVFEIGDSPEADTQRVWRGRLESAFVPLAPPGS